MKFGLFFIVLILTFNSDSVSSMSNPSFYCDSALNEENFVKNIGKEDECRYRRYKQRDFAECLDILAVNRSDIASGNSNGIVNHFAFFGDSRIRLQFYSFCRVIISITHFIKIHNNC